MQQLSSPLLAALLFVVMFIISAPQRNSAINRTNLDSAGQVVIAAPIQVLLYGGDRFLAANIEAIRAATIVIDNSNDPGRLGYRERSHRVVAELNPCHEDNYYLGNAILSWGGLQDQGTEILEYATQCRFWDEFPPFFLGFNQYFFYHNLDAAQRNLEVAASRSAGNAAALRKLAVMIKVEQIDDEAMALSYLQEQINGTSDDKLKKMLEKRLKRLEGLIKLRNAQQRYENRKGHPLKSPQQLISSGILTTFPEDPLHLGYEFSGGVFRLRELQIKGVDKQQ